MIEAWQTDHSLNWLTHPSLYQNDVLVHAMLVSSAGAKDIGIRSSLIAPSLSA